MIKYVSIGSLSRLFVSGPLWGPVSAGSNPSLAFKLSIKLETPGPAEELVGGGEGRLLERR